MSNDLKGTLIQQFIRTTEPDELRAWLDTLLPTVIDKLPKEERLALVKSITEEYLGALMRDFTEEERTALLEELLPVLLEEFSLKNINVLKLFG